jgi:hypothetical protein
MKAFREFMWYRAVPLMLTVFIIGCNKQSSTTADLEVIDYGINDYLPLAVGNTWSYRYGETTSQMTYGHSPGSTWSESYQEQWEIIAVRKPNDTTQIFTIVKSIGQNNRQDTGTITRTPSYILTRESQMIPRTGTTNTISYITNSSCCTPVQTTFRKGSGMVSQEWNFIVRITAGTSNKVSGARRLTQSTLKP